MFIPLSTLKLWAAQVQDGLTTTLQQLTRQVSPHKMRNTIVGAVSEVKYKRYRIKSESKVECLIK